MLRARPYVVILGASGSVGMQTAEILSKTDKVKTVALVCKASQQKLSEASRLTGCDTCLLTEGKNDGVLDSFIEEIVDKYGAENISCLNAIGGFDGFLASVSVARFPINLLLANKESVVAGGEIFLQYASANNCRVIPVDSEHSAIDTLIKNTCEPDLVEKVIITASGGPFRDRMSFDDISAAEAVRHPNWKMGMKISVDSSTLANKVMEMAEAARLFRLNFSQIEVVIQKESMIHSMVAMKNGAIYAEMSMPDMKLPISKALGLYEESFIKKPLWDGLVLNFSLPDSSRFPFLTLAADIINSHKKAIIFNAADEVAVKLFSEEKIKFTDIYKIVRKAVDSFGKICPDIAEPVTFDDILRIDVETRKFVTV